MPANWRNVAQFSTASVVAVAVVGLASSVRADGPPEQPQTFMSFDSENDPIDPFVYNPADFGGMEYGIHELGSNDPNTPGGPLRLVEGWRWNGTNQQTNFWSITWDCVVNADPFVDATINVTNTGTQTDTFTIYMPLNIFPSLLGGTIMSGSVSAVLSSNFTAGTVSNTNGLPIYQASIDGNDIVAAQLWNAPFALNSPAFQTNNASASFSNLAGPDAIAEIALVLQFTLTPGETASVTGIFSVEAVPAPAGLALLGLAGLVGGRRRRS